MYSELRMAILCMLFFVFVKSQWENYQYTVLHEGNRPLSSPPGEQMNSVLLLALYPESKRQWEELIQTELE